MHKILLIEDDDILQRMYKKLFLRRQFEVEVAKDAEEGFVKAKDLKPDFILLDVMMSKTNGIELLKKLKKHKSTKNIPVILLTNLGIQKELDKAVERGALRYIIKNDHDPNEVADIVQDYLQKP